MTLEHRLLHWISGLRWLLRLANPKAERDVPGHHGSIDQACGGTVLADRDDGPAVLRRLGLAVVYFAVPTFVLPLPSRIFANLYTNASLFLQASAVTGKLIAVSFFMSTAIGIPLGALLARSPWFAKTIYPLLVASQTFPKLAVGPLFIVWFGFGQTPKLLLAFLIAFFPIMLDTHDRPAVGAGRYLMLARSIGLGSARTFLRIQLPQALPSIFSGLKIGATLSVLGVLVAEFLGATGGLGYLVITATGMLDTVLLFSALVVIAVLGLVVYGIVSLAEHLAIGSWYGAQLHTGSGGPH